MQIEVTIKNYRCFPYDRPAQFTIGDGLTAFLGVNNSGKSSLLKFFYEFRSMFQSLSEPGGALLFALRGIPQAFGPASSVRDIAELFCNSNSRDLEIVLKFSPNQAAEKSALVVPTTTTISIPRSSNTFTATIEPINEDIRWNSVKIDGTNMNLVLASKPIAHISHIFYGFKFLANTMYIASFRNAINFGAAPGYYDIDVGQAFISKWDQYKSGLIIRDINAAIKLTEDIKRIFDFTSLEINATQDNRTLQIIINGKSYTLPELGSGIAQFIQVLASAAMRSPSYILIDEPELNLHAQLQLDFLTTLASYATEGTLFCTHSIGLARTAADTIYTIRRIGEGASEVRNYDATVTLTEFLGELNFSGRELGFDNVLFVEGPTDVKTVQQFLRLYNKDRRFVLISLGGAINPSRQTDLEEILRITKNVLVLIDSERDRPNAELESNRRDFIDICRKHDIKCHVLERRAIENYFIDRAVKEVKGSKCRSLGHYEKFEDVDPRWRKRDNWRIAREMTREEIAETDVGQFIDLLGV